MIRCSDDSLYTGYTTDVSRRVTEHDNGEGAKYTKGRAPVQLVFVQLHDEKSCAMSEEYHTKQHTKKEKESVVGSDKSVRIDICEKCFILN